MDRQFISFPKSGRSWLRYGLHRAGVADKILFHHDGFEYNDGSKPPLDFNFSERLRRYDKSNMIVYLERDPRDVIVSLYYQITGRFDDFFNFQGSISDFIRDPYFGAENLQRFRSQWAELCADGRAFPISYEACHSDFAGTLAKIIAYYKFDVEKEVIAIASREATFTNMKTIEASGASDFPWLKMRNGASKVRKGKIHGFIDELTSEDMVYLDGVFRS